jgi:hypothetical protein
MQGRPPDRQPQDRRSRQHKLPAGRRGSAAPEPRVNKGQAEQLDRRASCERRAARVSPAGSCNDSGPVTGSSPDPTLPNAAAAPLRRAAPPNFRSAARRRSPPRERERPFQHIVVEWSRPRRLRRAADQRRHVADAMGSGRSRPRRPPRLPGGRPAPDKGSHRSQGPRPRCGRPGGPHRAAMPRTEAPHRGRHARRGPAVAATDADSAVAATEMNRTGRAACEPVEPSRELT